MKICLFADAQSIHTQRIATGLASRSHSVHVVTHKPANIPGVTIERFGVPAAGLTNPYRWNSRRLRYLREFTRRFDIINIQFLQDWGFTQEMLDEGCFVVTPWGSDIVQAPGEDAPSDELRNHRVMLLQNAATVTAWGNAFARSIAEFANIHESDIRRIPLGVDLELFKLKQSLTTPAMTNSLRDSTHYNPTACESPRPNSPPLPREDKVGSTIIQTTPHLDNHPNHVGFFKGFRAVYGPTYLIEAIPLVLDVLPHTRFTLVGDGPQLEQCQQTAQTIGISSAINWLPPQPHDRIPSLLAQWDLTVIPSICESFGAAALETAAMKIPVVASRVGGLIDTVRHNETGLLVPPKNPPALAAAMVELLKNPDRRQQMGRSARRFVEVNFNWNHCIDLWVQTFEQALSHRAILT